MKNVTLSDLRDLLDEEGVRHVKRQNVLVANLSADSNFAYDVSVVFTIEGDGSRIRAVAWSGGFHAPRANRRQAMEFCNEWNAEKAAPRAYLDSDGDFRLDLSLFTDVDLDASYIKENFINLFISTSWQFFKSAGQKFSDLDALSLEKD